MNKKPTTSRTGPPADMMVHLVWLPLLILGIGLVAGCALPVFNWLMAR